MFLSSQMVGLGGHYVRNIKIGLPEIGDRMHVGEVVRRGSGTFVHNLEGRRTATIGSAIRIRHHAHHQGTNCFRSDRNWEPKLPSHARIVCIDVRKIRCCSYNSVAFHSFVWPLWWSDGQKYCTHIAH